MTKRVSATSPRVIGRRSLWREWSFDVCCVPGLEGEGAGKLGVRWRWS